MEELNRTLESYERVEQNENKPSKGYKVASVILIALWFIGYLFMTAILISCLVEAFAEGGWAWIGFALIFALSIIVYAVVLLLALAGLITTIVYKSKKKNCKLIQFLVAFIVLSVLPVISEIIFYLVATIIN